MQRLFTVLAAALLGLALTPVAAQADTYDGPINRIINGRSDRCLDQDYSGGTPHATILVWLCSPNSTNQQWRVTPQGNYWYTIRNVRSGQCLDQADPASGTTYRLQAYKCNGGLNQRWKLTWLRGGGLWARVQAPLSTDGYPRYLDQDYSGGVQHSTPLLWKETGGLNQEWAFPNL